MKILILCSNYEPGGAQRVALRLNDSLNNEGYETQTWFLNRKTPNFSNSTPNLVYDKRVNAKGFLILWYSLIKLIVNYKPDVVLTMLPYANIIGLFTAWLCGVKKRIASHRNVCDKELSRILKKIDAFFANSGLYTQITAVSNDTKKSFSNYSKKAYNKISVINNGLEYTIPKASKENCRKKFGFEKDEFLIGSIGRLVEQKNHLFLINLLQFLPNVKLVIVGKGPLENDILNKTRELKITTQLCIIKEVKAEDIPYFLKCLNIFIMPSIYEGLSNALIEAMFAGLPILTSDVPSQKDVIIRNSDGLEAGIVLPLNKPNLWIKTIKRLKNEPEYCKNLITNALNRSKDFTIKKMTDGYIKVFNTK